MSSIAPGLPQIRNLGLEQASETLPIEPGSLNPQNQDGADPNSPDAIGQALSGLSQDLGGGQAQGASGDLRRSRDNEEGRGVEDRRGDDGGRGIEGDDRQRRYEARQGAEGSRIGTEGGSQNGGGQFGAQLGSTYGRDLSSRLGGRTGGQLGGDAGALVSDLQSQAQDEAQGGLKGAIAGLGDAQNIQQAETKLQNDDAKAREARGEGVAQANQDAAADVKNFVAQQTQTGETGSSNSGGSGNSSGSGGSNNFSSSNQTTAPPQQPAAGGASSASGTSGSTPLTGNESIGPKVPSALQPFQQQIAAAAKQTGVPASLLGAQILQESGGNPNAVTTNPALGLADTGLMQVDSATFAGLQQQYPQLLGGQSVSNPATNIMAGALLDAQLIKQNNGNVSQALTDYNGNATSGYAEQVLAKQSALQNGTAVPGGFS
jgi:hypothetical protein